LAQLPGDRDDIMVTIIRPNYGYSSINEPRWPKSHLPRH